MPVNRLLKGIAVYLVIAVLLSLIGVSSIHGKILIDGELMGREFLSQQDLKTFYESINSYLDIRLSLEELDHDTLMHTDLAGINRLANRKSVEIVAIYDQMENWSLGSDPSIDLLKAKRRYNRGINAVSTLLLPPVEFDDYYILNLKSSDQKEVYIVILQDQDAIQVFNKYAFSVYKIQWLAIAVALLISFLPIIINMIFNYYIPLKKLQNATELIAGGELNFSIESKGLDEIKSLSNAFEHMRHELEASKKRESLVLDNRKQLITNISHDLRTPITSIRGYVEGLIDGKGTNPERMERYLRTIRDKTAYLNNMIEDLFLFSQLDLGEYKIEPRRWQSSEVLNILFEPIELWVEDSGWTFEAETPFHSGIIEIDQMRLAQVLENIVQNSLKYGPDHGTITVKTAIENHYYNITISDNGEGIEKTAIKYVFDAFYREDGSRQQSMGGSGLGLAICKKLVELHGGHIYIDSEIGVGTSIVLSFPLKY